jgi:hypothetical protein
MKHGRSSSAVSRIGHAWKGVMTMPHVTNGTIKVVRDALCNVAHGQLHGATRSRLAPLTKVRVSTWPRDLAFASRL